MERTNQSARGNHLATVCFDRHLQLKAVLLVGRLDGVDDMR
jgi:hypothetical protein